MKRSIPLFIAAVLLVAFSSQASAQKSELAGKWKIDRSKTQKQDDWPLLTGINIRISGDSLYTERLYELTDGQQYPFNEALTLDNKEANTVVYEMPRKMKAQWIPAESVLKFESTTTSYGNGSPLDFVSVETWITDPATKTLTISFVNKISGTEVPGKLVFTR